MSPTEKRDLERVRYWQGQLLRSRDFNDIHAAEEQRRWWHNRALHNAYGIHQDPDTGPGFGVAFTTDMTGVTVTAGLAYDSFGRELVLETSQIVPLPPISLDRDEEFLLLIRYRMQPPNRCTEDVSGVCFTNSGPVRPGFVEFTWKHSDKCSFTDGVPLITLKVQKGETSLVAVSQPSSRPLARPQLGSGCTVPGNTPWELWTDGFDLEPNIFGVQTTIDTSAAGFTDAPCYFAWLEGNLFNPQTRQLVPALFTSIAQESVNSFIFRIAFPELQGQIFAEAAALPPVTQLLAEDFALFAHQQNLYVSWVGCQKNASAPFFFTFFRNPIILMNLNLLRFPQPFLNFNILESDVIR